MIDDSLYVRKAEARQFARSQHGSFLDKLLRNPSVSYSDLLRAQHVARPWEQPAISKAIRTKRENLLRRGQNYKVKEQQEQAASEVQ